MVQHNDIDHTGVTGVTGGVTVQDEGTPLATLGTTLDFVGAGVVASGTGATKTITIAGGSFDEDLLPWMIDIVPFLTSASHTNWNTNTANPGSGAATIMNGCRDSSGAQNAEIHWPLVLAAGTWNFEILSRDWSDRGIYTLFFDASSKGTMDGYNASDTLNVLHSVTGITVATSGKVDVSLKMATKNASSSNYRGSIQAVRLLRTA